MILIIVTAAKTPPGLKRGQLDDKDDADDDDDDIGNKDADDDADSKRNTQATNTCGFSHG